MIDYLLFFLPLSVAGNVALILTVIDDIKKAKEKEIKILSLEADVWHYRSNKKRSLTMDQIDEIKEMIRGMMAQEMENFKEAVSNGECDETASPVVYTMLQVLLTKIEQMPKVWHDVSEKPDSSLAPKKEYIHKNIQIGFSFVGNFDSRDELEREAPRKEANVANTRNATYCYDGKEWTLLKMDRFIAFKVLSRHYITGRGHVTVVHNPDLLPIECNKSLIFHDGQFRLPIHGIERQKTLTDPPKVKPDWGLVTSEKTIGDWLTIRMYPDEEDEPANLDNKEEC